MMGKQKHDVAVAELPFIDSLREVSIADRKRYGLYLPSGQINYYRLQKMKGQGGSRKDETWDQKRHTHSCCNSRVNWRHKTDCRLLKFKEPSHE